jgi:hypothetical protein
MKLEFSLQIFQKYISNSMKVRPVQAELFFAGGHTDVTKITTAFSDSANAPKNYKAQ